MPTIPVSVTLNEQQKMEAFGKYIPSQKYRNCWKDEAHIFRSCNVPSRYIMRLSLTLLLTFLSFSGKEVSQHSSRVKPVRERTSTEGTEHGRNQIPHSDSQASAWCRTSSWTNNQPVSSLVSSFSACSKCWPSYWSLCSHVLTVSDVTQIYIVILKHQLRWSVTFQCFLFGNDSVWETRKFVCNKRTKSLEKCIGPVSATHNKEKPKARKTMQRCHRVSRFVLF